LERYTVLRLPRQNFTNALVLQYLSQSKNSVELIPSHYQGAQVGRGITAETQMHMLEED
jgi:hypothetical protein